MHLSLLAAEGGFSWAGFWILIGLIWIGAAIYDACKPKGYTVRHKGHTTVTPNK